jgi:hypothetical protein
VKISLIYVIYERASTVFQEQWDLFNEIVARYVIFIWTVISKVSFTWLLIPRAAVIWEKRESLWALCISHIWGVFQRTSNV